MVWITHRVLFPIALIVMLTGAIGSASAGEVRIAVAANFSGVLSEIAEMFSAETGHDVIVSTGSTGLLYTQIVQGAPFDVFLAADRARPMRLVEEGLAVPDSLFTYAIGRLVLFSTDPALIEDASSLENPSIERLATANPKTAPYGKAAEEVLKAHNLLESFTGRIVQGANIAQTYQFVASGSVDAGFVALSQVMEHSDGSRWVVPADQHGVLAQDAVLLSHAGENPVSLAFMSYLRTPGVRKLIESRGYEAPTGP